MLVNCFTLKATCFLRILCKRLNVEEGRCNSHWILPREGMNHFGGHCLWIYAWNVTGLKISQGTIKFTFSTLRERIFGERSLYHMCAAPLSQRKCA
jgi:hypothetical protein